MRSRYQRQRRTWLQRFFHDLPPLLLGSKLPRPTVLQSDHFAQILHSHHSSGFALTAKPKNDGRRLAQLDGFRQTLTQ
jgi:hypothetical protein